MAARQPADGRHKHTIQRELPADGRQGGRGRRGLRCICPIRFKVAMHSAMACLAAPRSAGPCARCLKLDARRREARRVVGTDSLFRRRRRAARLTDWLWCSSIKHPRCQRMSWDLKGVQTCKCLHFGSAPPEGRMIRADKGVQTRDPNRTARACRRSLADDGLSGDSRVPTQQEDRLQVFGPITTFSLEGCGRSLRQPCSHFGKPDIEIDKV